MFATEDIIATVALDAKLFNLPEGIKSNDYFLMTADGHGMINAGIYNNDILLFKKTTTPEIGSIVVAEHEGARMCRRLLKKGKKYVLRRENNETPDIITDKVTVLGELVSLIRNFTEQ